MNILLFTYGSNISHDQIKKRCPNSKFIKRAYHKGFKFVYDGYSFQHKSAAANIIKSKECEVWGGLFEITKEGLAKLDCFEGYPNSYDRKKVGVKDEEGNSYNVIVYFREGKKIGKPHKDYRDIILKGSRDCNLPGKYIEDFLC